MPFANISNDSQTVALHLKTTNYALGDRGSLYMITEGERESLGAYSGGVIQVDLELEPLGVFVLEVVPE